MPYADIGREVGAREAAYWDKPEEAAQKAGVTKDLLLALAAQKALSTQQAAQRNTDMGMQIPAGSIVEQNMQLLQQRDPRAVAQNTGGVAQQQAQQMQDRMRQLAGSGIAGAAPAGMAANAPRGGIADAVRPTPHRMAEGGVVPPPQQNLTGPTPSLSSDAANFLNMYKQFQRAMQNPQLRPEEKAKLERNFQMSTQNFSTDTKAEAFNYLDTESGLGAELKMRCGGMVNKYNRGGVVALNEGGGPLSLGGSDLDLERLLDAIRIVESRGNPLARSRKGARGAYQIMPNTGRQPGYGIPSIDVENSTEEEQRAWAREFIGAALREFDGDIEAAIASYNRGIPGTKRDLAGESSRPRETRNYIPKVLAAYERLGGQNRTAPSGRRPTGRAPAMQTGLGGALPTVPSHIDEQQYPQTGGTPARSSAPVYPGRPVPEQGREPQDTAFANIANMQRADQLRNEILRSNTPLQQPMPESGVASAAPRSMALQPVDPTIQGIDPPTLRGFPNADAAAGERASRSDNVMGYNPANISAGGRGLENAQPIGERLTEIRQDLGNALGITAPATRERQLQEREQRMQQRQVQPPPTAAQAQPLQPPTPATDAQIPIAGVDPQQAIARALVDKFGTKGVPKQQAPQATGIAQAALNDRIAQMTDPRRAKMQDLAAMLAGAGGYRNMGNMGKGMVAAGMESQKRREDSLDAMLNDQLNRESQESIYASRDQAGIEQARLRALAENLKARDPEAYLKKGDEFDERYRELIMGQIEEELAKESGDRNIGTPEFRAEVERRYQIEREKYIVNSMNSAYSAMNTVENPRSQTQAAADAILGI